MTSGALSRTVVVAWVTCRGAFSGAGGLGLIGAASLYPILIAAIAASHFPGLDLLNTAELLFSALFLPVVLLLVSLVLGVGLFRGELEEDTLVYPMSRTVPRPALVAGKFLGLVTAALVTLLPSAILGAGLAAALTDGPTRGSPGLAEALVLLTILGVAAYGSYFLLLGLLTRQALVIGLLYGFLWETFISLIPGPIRHLTIIYYLRGVGARLVGTGALSDGPSDVTVLGASAGLLLTVATALVLASLYLRYSENRPAAAPA
jgi:ABC-2 type transport system permease protein